MQKSESAREEGNEKVESSDGSTTEDRGGDKVWFDESGPLSRFVQSFVGALLWFASGCARDEISKSLIWSSCPDPRPGIELRFLIVFD